MYMEYLVLLPLIVMIVWDIKFRYVLLWHVLAFGTIQLVLCWQRYGWQLAGINALMNLISVLLITIFIHIYVYIRFQDFRTKVMGGGDVVFIILLTPYFSYRDFLLFLVSSFTITLIIWGVYSLKKKEAIATADVPLVSGMGICYSLLLIYHITCSSWI